MQQLSIGGEEAMRLKLAFFIVLRKRLCKRQAN